MRQQRGFQGGGSKGEVTPSQPCYRVVAQLKNTEKIEQIKPKGPLPNPLPPKYATDYIAKAENTFLASFYNKVYF